MSTLRSSLNVVELPRLRKWVRKVGVFILLPAHKTTVFLQYATDSAKSTQKKREIRTFITNRQRK